MQEAKNGFPQKLFQTRICDGHHGARPSRLFRLVSSHHTEDSELESFIHVDQSRGVWAFVSFHAVMIQVLNGTECCRHIVWGVKPTDVGLR